VHVVSLSVDVVATGGASVPPTMLAGHFVPLRLLSHSPDVFFFVVASGVAIGGAGVAACTLAGRYSSA
jgi:hypothetical protein